MNRRQFVQTTSFGLAAALTIGVPAHAATTRHERAMAACKAEIRRHGERLKASAWRNAAARERIALEARLFAQHHRALAALKR